jgi:hypothetical protein
VHIDSVTPTCSTRSTPGGARGGPSARPRRDTGVAEARSRKKSLPEHLDRVCERITLRAARLTPAASSDSTRCSNRSSTRSRVERSARTIAGDARSQVMAAACGTGSADARRRSSRPPNRHPFQAAREEALEQLQPFRRSHAIGDVRAGVQSASRSPAARIAKDCQRSDSNEAACLAPIHR